MNPEIANLPLRDIHLPEPVSWWPLAPGWWITIALLVLAAGTVVVLKKMRERQQLAKQSLTEFTTLVDRFQKDGDINQLLTEVSQLLRRVSITQFEHRNVAGLTGDNWLAFLDEALANRPNERALSFQGELGEFLVVAQYQRQKAVDPEKLDQLLVLTKAWLLTVCKHTVAIPGFGKIQFAKGER